MLEVFHKGEIAVQKLAGVEKMASRIGNSIRTVMHPIAQNFLKHQPFVITASIDKNGRVWTSILTGDNGFLNILDEMTLEFETRNIGQDILYENLKSNKSIGLLGIEFETRLRMRLNGQAEIKDDSVIIHAKEVFSNCQKYIQARTWKRKENEKKNLSKPQKLKILNSQQKDLITAADTFFIASHNKDRGADASHRGGNPGFVKILDDSTIIFPDYQGNTMFQTLGNIQQNPNCGLLFVNFEDGNILQLSGKAKIVWDEKIFSQFAGAERAVEFQIEKIIETRQNLPFLWEFKDYSPANPN